MGVGTRCWRTDYSFGRNMATHFMIERRVINQVTSIPRLSRSLDVRFGHSALTAREKDPKRGQYQSEGRYRANVQRGPMSHPGTSRGTRMPECNRSSRNSSIRVQYSLYVCTLFVKEHDGGKSACVCMCVRAS